jgi:CheY-like chemotaxis protein
LHPISSVKALPVPLKKILVVDDHDDSREICRQLLTFYGYDVRVAENGVAAVRAALEDAPDLVLLDFLMPHGNGLETLEAMRTQPSLSNTRYVLYTAAITEREWLSTVEGVEAVLFKPVETALLLEVVQSILGIPSQSQTASS